MANDFLNSDILVQAVENASILLRNNLAAGNLINRDVEEDIVDKDTGGQVNVKVRPELAANIDEENKGNQSLSTTDNQQKKVPVDATKYVYLRQDIPTPEGTWDLESFTSEVVEPAALAIRQKIDEYLVRRIAGGYSRNMELNGGSEGNSPASVSDITNAMRALHEQKAPQSGRAALISPATHANLLELDQFTSADYGDDAPVGLRNGALEQRYGFSFFMDQNVGTHPFGDTGGTVVTNGEATAGDSTVSVDGLSTADGVIRQGTRFQFGGSGQIYTVTADAFYTGSSVDLEITPTVQNTQTDATGITFRTQHTQDTFFVPDFVLGAIVAPEPLMGAPSEVATFDNVSIRATMVSSIDGGQGAVDQILWDVYTGANVLKPETGVIQQS